MQDEIMTCIFSAIETVNSTLSNKLNITKDRECLLYGGEGFDSISLVLLISLVEQNLEDHFNKPFILADEKAMSMKNSPFSSVGRLYDHIVKMLKDEP